MSAGGGKEYAAARCWVGLARIIYYNFSPGLTLILTLTSIMKTKVSPGLVQEFVLCFYLTFN